MTSNVGADLIKRQTSLGFNLKKDEQVEERLAYQDMRKKLIDSLKRVFRPEFINRLDSVVVFRALNREDIQKIVSLELDKVAVRLSEHEITLTATPDAINLLADLGYDPEMGARPLRRVIQQKVEDPLSDALLSGEFDAKDTVVIDIETVEDEVNICLRHEEEEGDELSPSEEIMAVS
jgi:ATP-dependent Clp protease ATP-binding subunit ClpC